MVTFDWLKEVMGSFPPEMQEHSWAQLLPYTYTEGYDYDNDILYTNRLRLQMDAKVSDSVDFSGRLSMYKVWGDSTGVQTFNGSATSINIDGTTASVPNSDILRVERAYFTWRGPKFYLSIGRRPSTGGVPLNFPQRRAPRWVAAGNARQLSVRRSHLWLAYQRKLDDAPLLRRRVRVRLRQCRKPQAARRPDQGRVIPGSQLGHREHRGPVHSDNHHASAFDVTDGFAGLVVLPVDPVTGQDVPAPVVLRYAPSENLGDISWASLVAVAHPGAFDVFGSLSYMESDPNDITTPFGGIFSDPFQAPEKQDGYMYYIGARYNFANNKTKVGLEYNYGSEYWFNMAVAEDSLFAPKTSVRGDVWELYLTHRITKNFILKLDYMKYNFDYSGSGWHLGAPHELDSTPILGFASPTDADRFLLGLQARF